jgi:hypothetical protein
MSTKHDKSSDADAIADAVTSSNSAKKLARKLRSAADRALHISDTAVNLAEAAETCADEADDRVRRKKAKALSVEEKTAAVAVAIDLVKTCFAPFGESLKGELYVERNKEEEEEEELYVERSECVGNLRELIFYSEGKEAYAMELFRLLELPGRATRIRIFHTAGYQEIAFLQIQTSAAVMLKTETRNHVWQGACPCRNGKRSNR